MAPNDANFTGAAQGREVFRGARKEPDIRLARYLQMTMAGLTAAVALLILINQDHARLNATAITDTSVINGGIQDQQASHTTREQSKQASDRRHAPGAAETSRLRGSLLHI